jgi:two-component system, chemotaxis family, chemotaxis protein CheY
MEKPHIVCVDDQRDVLATLKKELAFFREYLSIVYCESAQEAMTVLDELDAKGAPLALLICDHVMPGKNGVEFLSDIKRDERFTLTKKLLLTGLATHEDTIKAINNAEIDRYISKPWDTHELIDMCRKLITEYILAAGIEYREYIVILDQETLYQVLKTRT